MANALYRGMKDRETAADARRPGDAREDSSGIKIKKSKRGSLHKALGIPEGQSIPTSLIRSRLSGASGNMREKLQFALTAKTKFNR